MVLMNDGVKRIAFGYTRVSTEEQTIGWYTDAGISAKTAHRPELQKMLADIARHKSYILILRVKSLERISLAHFTE